jgi:hypothetical protein
MMASNNTNLSGKFLELAMQALENQIQAHRLILDNKSNSDEDLAAIDYGNDLECMRILQKEWSKLQTTSDTEQSTTKYTLLQSKTDQSILLQVKDAPQTDDCELLFAFEAADYNSAMTIRNKFLDFEPYVPFSEHIAATRTLTLFDTDKNALTDVQVMVYQPVKAGENEWHCEYHININYKNTQGNPIKSVNLGGKKIIGFDMVQAIQATFLVIDSIISAYNNENENQIFWLEYGDDCGFVKK